MTRAQYLAQHNAMATHDSADDQANKRVRREEPATDAETAIGATLSGASFSHAPPVTVIKSKTVRHYLLAGTHLGWMPVNPTGSGGLDSQNRLCSTKSITKTKSGLGFLTLGYVLICLNETFKL